jgi:hypothetical protein
MSEEIHKTKKDISYYRQSSTHYLNPVLPQQKTEVLPFHGLRSIGLNLIHIDTTLITVLKIGYVRAKQG